MGNWFAKGDERLERTVLATKLYGDMTPGILRRMSGVRL